jgi:hypothetical protein
VKAREVRVFTPNRALLFAILSKVAREFPDRGPYRTGHRGKNIQLNRFSNFGEIHLGVGFVVDWVIRVIQTPVRNIANFFDATTSNGGTKEKGTPLLTRLQFDR